MKRLGWTLVFALAIVGSGACIAEVRQPWMTLVAGGNEYDGLLISYCWAGFGSGVCADGMMREPPLHTIRSDGAVTVQVRTRAGLTDLHVRVGPDWQSGGEFRQVDPARAEVLRLGAGTYYIAVGANWPRGDGLFLFGLRVERAA